MSNVAALRVVAKFRRLSKRERLLYLRVAPLLVIAKLALYVFPFEFVRRRLFDARPVATPVPDANDAQQIVKAIRAVSKRLALLNVNCLPQALVAYKLLHRAGVDADLRIGVGKDADNKLTAHAWVEAGGEILMGQVAGIVDLATFPALGIKQGQKRRIRTRSQ